MQANNNNQKRQVYLDYAATTPVDPQVVEAMLPGFTELWGNPSNLYRQGREANHAMREARETVAAILNCRPTEIVFTSGGTESDNLALKGVALAAKAKTGANHIITTAFEHHAILHAAEYLEQFGIETTLVPVSREGYVSPDDIERAIRPGQTSLISVMYANNEIGTVQPLAAIAEVAHRYGVLLHSDGVQAPGQLPLDVKALGVDLMSLAAHKFYGPKGVGLLYIRSGIGPLQYQMQGGSQESKRRAGTENVPYILGLAKALSLSEANRPKEAMRLAELRDRLLEGIVERVNGVHLNGGMEQRLPGNLNLSFEGIGSEGILQALDIQGISASNGSACNVGSIEPSHVIAALGQPHELAAGTLRLTLGKYTTIEDIDYVLAKLPPVVNRMRAVESVAR